MNTLAKTASISENPNVHVIDVSETNAPTDNPFWREIQRQEAEKAFHAGSDLLVQYSEYWTVPSGASGWDEGFLVREGGKIKTCRTWDLRASPNVRALFGGGAGQYSFFVPYTTEQP